MMTRSNSNAHQEIRLAVAGACVSGLINPLLIVPTFLIILILAVAL